MEIYQLIHFIAIVETGSFTKGADRATISQSTISVSIAKLEAEFGVRLLVRRSPVVPTAAGQRVFEAGKAILHIYGTLKGELETVAKPKLLRIGILQSFSSRQVSKLLSSFRRSNSHVVFEVCDVPSEQLLELLDGQQLDAVLTILDDSSSNFAESGSLHRTICIGCSRSTSVRTEKKRNFLRIFMTNRSSLGQAVINSKTLATRLFLAGSRCESCIERPKSTGR